jgi:hypothetical protein
MIDNSTRKVSVPFEFCFLISKTFILIVYKFQKLTYICIIMNEEFSYKILVI